MKGVAVYELLVNGAVVYIGATAKPHRRCYAHRANLHLEVWPEIRVVQWCRTRSAALRLEARLIRKHKPPLNIQQANRRRVQRPDLARAREIWTSASPKLTNREVLARMPAGWTAADARAAFGSRYASLHNSGAQGNEVIVMPVPRNRGRKATTFSADEMRTARALWRNIKDYPTWSAAQAAFDVKVEGFTTARAFRLWRGRK